MEHKQDLKNFTLKQLTEFTTAIGLPKFRANQIFSWLYRQHITDFSQMTDLSFALRELLTQKAIISGIAPAAEEISKDGTRKYAFRLEDDAVIESVLIPEGDRHTLCISSQVGCAMGCTFCLTGAMGFTRNLTPAEIVGQVAAVQEKMIDDGLGEISNLVFMGMGEPLANLDNVVTAIDILLDQRGLNFSERRITVSTCGLVPKIKELGARTKTNLAVSLHAVKEEIRNKLMPVNKTYPVETLLAACREYPLPKRKRIMIEYILIKGVNDSEEDAHLLAEKLQEIRCKINLLPFNECSELPFKKPADEQVARFQKILWEAGYTVIVRSSRGADISAACGQLARRQ